MNRIKYIVAAFALITAFYAAPSTWAQPAEEQYQLLFEKANTAYAQKQYKTAFADYEKILNAGLASGKLYYNMGNTCFKLGILGKAKAYYEKALSVGYQDIDLAANLSFLNSQLIDQQEELNDTVAARLSGMLSKKGWIVVFCVFYLLLFACAGTRLFVRTGKRALSVVCAVCMVICALCAAAYLQQRLNHTKFGVITAKSAQIMYTPSNTGETFFVLHEGAKVKITGNEGAWQQVQFGKNKRGWTEKINMMAV